LEDGTSVLSLFFDPDYADMLSMGVPNPLDVEGNEVEDMKVIISQKRDELIQGLGLIKNFRQRRLIDTALLALEFLESLYTGKSMDNLREMIPEGDEDEGTDEVTPDEDNEEPTDDDADFDFVEE
jgi:hypothetical protein